MVSDTSRTQEAGAKTRLLLGQRVARVTSPGNGRGPICQHGGGSKTRISKGDF